MPKVLTDTQVQSFQRDGFLSPVRAMSAERARHCRERFESLEARVADIKKMKTKSHLLCPWVLDIAEEWRPYRSLATSYLFSAAFEPAGAAPVAPPEP